MKIFNHNLFLDIVSIGWLGRDCVVVGIKFTDTIDDSSTFSSTVMCSLYNIM